MKLTLERLSKQFKNRIAVDNVNAELAEGVYGFLGAKNDAHADDLRDRCSDKRGSESRRKKQCGDGNGVS